MMSKRESQYILDGHNVVPVTDLMEWARWMESADRRVAKTKIGAVEVSTVFLGLDHQWGKGAPLIFETMIFGGAHNGYQKRCSTWEEAERMHAAAVALVSA